MSGTTTRRTGSPSAFAIMQPPISCDEASEYIKAPIPVEAWEKIESAFSRYGKALDRLGASRAGKSKEPTKASWHERQKNTAKALEAALDRLKSARSHGDFLQEASENYALATLGQSAGEAINADKLLRDAYRKISDALMIIERSEPREIVLPTAATARAILIRDLRDALAESGIDAKASTGRYTSDLARPLVLGDLTPFEQFLDGLGVGEDLSIASFATTIRAALKG